MTLLKTIGLTLALSSATAAPALAQQAYHRGGGASAIVYAHPDFRGHSVRVTGPVDTLKRYGLNDKASSVRITGGSWEVCVDPNFRGRCEVISYNQDELNDYRLNDKITSIRPVNYRGGHDRGDRWGRHDGYRDRGHGGRPGYGDRGPRGPGYGGGYDNAPVTLFKDPDFRGGALPVSGAVPSLADYRFNDTISSIAVRGGAWEVCSDPNFRGRCEIFTSSVGSTKYYRLNDNISSIRPAGRNYGGRW